MNWKGVFCVAALVSFVLALVQSRVGMEEPANHNVTHGILFLILAELQ